MNIREVYDSIDRKQISFNYESLNYFQGDGYHPNSNDCYVISTLFDNGMSKWKKKIAFSLSKEIAVRLFNISLMQRPPKLE